MTDTKERVVEYVRSNPGASYRGIGQALGVSQSTAHEVVMALLEDGTLNQVPCTQCGRKTLRPAKRKPVSRDTARRMPTDVKPKAHGRKGRTDAVM